MFFLGRAVSLPGMGVLVQIGAGRRREAVSVFQIGTTAEYSQLLSPRSWQEPRSFLSPILFCFPSLLSSLAQLLCNWTSCCPFSPTSKGIRSTQVAVTVPGFPAHSASHHFVALAKPSNRKPPWSAWSASKLFHFRRTAQTAPPLLFAKSPSSSPRSSPSLKLALCDTQHALA